MGFNIYYKSIQHFCLIFVELKSCPLHKPTENRESKHSNFSGLIRENLNLAKILTETFGWLKQEQTIILSWRNQMITIITIIAMITIIAIITIITIITMITEPENCTTKQKHWRKTNTEEHEQEK
ncbi:hypothetical protein Glove_568g12 [Diversispora epigaea]|uniref:Uncharacterized protein n=1 Tax=Diversispora epigaea TaxID=1348612 RepID=A0A397GDN7_9GLOM|nr:hypothetical protein Glove_568g12 [Diversispora epigaea]